MPRSRSVMTNTGVWNFSAKSKASMAMEKHSCGEAGKYMGCLVSPWESSAVVIKSLWGCQWPGVQAQPRHTRYNRDQGCPPCSDRHVRSHRPETNRRGLMAYGGGT